MVYEIINGTPESQKRYGAAELLPGKILLSNSVLSGGYIHIVCVVITRHVFNTVS